MRFENKGLAFVLPVALILLVAGLTVTLQALSTSTEAKTSAETVAAVRSEPEAAPAEAAEKPQMMAQEQAAEPAQTGATTTTTTSQHGGWTVSCTSGGEPAKKTCSAQFRVASKENNNALVLVWLVGRDAKDTLLAEFATPSDVMIKPGVSVSLDEAKAETAEYVSCSRNQGCRASIELTPKLARSLKQAKKASVGITMLNGKVMQIGVDISGVEQAMAELGA